MTCRYSGKWTSYDALRAKKERSEREMEDQRMVRTAEALAHINFRSLATAQKQATKRNDFSYFGRFATEIGNRKRLILAAPLTSSAKAFTG